MKIMIAISSMVIQNFIDVCSFSLLQKNSTKLKTEIREFSDRRDRIAIVLTSDSASGAGVVGILTDILISNGRLLKEFST